MAVSDRVYVMRQGKVVAERMTADTNIEELAFLMVGRQIVNRVIQPVHAQGTLLETKGLRLTERRSRGAQGHRHPPSTLARSSASRACRATVSPS